MTSRTSTWGDFAIVVEHLADRIGDADDFAVRPGSSLAGDDRASKPFKVSEAIRHIINAAVDQLHGVKVAAHDAKLQHLAVSARLARAAIENAAAGLWILGPHLRDSRIERVLRWHSRNDNDFQLFLDADDLDTTAEAERNRAALEQIRGVAQARGIDPKSAAGGFRVTTPLTECSEFTDLPVYTTWQIASGFAHGRPWAYHGLLQREDITVGDQPTYRLSAKQEMTTYLPPQAMHVLAELLRMRDLRAGIRHRVITTL